MLKLSKRLQAIADFVTTGFRVADIGSDHGMLPVYLLQAGKCPAAIAGELNRGPYEAAVKQAAAAGLSQRLSVRQGDGLAVLQPGEADTITIAGMGGSLMSGILEAGRLAGKLEGVRELVLQPNVGEDLVREWLLQHNWFLQAETILEEDGKIYEVLHAAKTADAREQNERIYDGAFLQVPYTGEQKQAIIKAMGPYLLRRPLPVLHVKWRQELAKLAGICERMSGSALPESAAKLEQFRAQIRTIEEVLQCLQTDTPSSS
jgi:tRNA (adenine22-N1)-methyltransferase